MHSLGHACRYETRWQPILTIQGRVQAWPKECTDQYRISFGNVAPSVVCLSLLDQVTIWSNYWCDRLWCLFMQFPCHLQDLMKLGTISLFEMLMMICGRPHTFDMRTRIVFRQCVSKTTSSACGGSIIGIQTHITGFYWQFYDKSKYHTLLAINRIVITFSCDRLLIVSNRSFAFNKPTY